MKLLNILFFLLSISSCGNTTRISAETVQKNNANVFEFKVSAVLNGTRLYTYITNVSKCSIELRMNIGDKRGSQFLLFHQGDKQVGTGDIYDVNGTHKILLSPNETKVFYNSIGESAQNASRVRYCLIYENPLNSQVGGVNKDVNVSNMYDPYRNINVVGVSGEPVFLSQDIDQKPEFPGGNGALMDYISRNLKYPKWRIDNITRVIVGTIIEKDGAMSHLHIVRSEGEELDSLALKVFQNPPQWTPGCKDGKPVRVYWTFPVIFRER